jgi:hypothetical protein
MTTSQKAAELVQDLGLNHAIYVTEEVIAILEDWKGTELAQKDWVKIKEIIRSIEPFKEQVLLQSSIDGEVIWGEPKKETLEENCTCTDECLCYLTKTCKGIETLKEAAERYNLSTTNAFFDYHSFINGAEWQQERSYSEEEVLNKLTHFAVEIQRQNKQGIVPLQIKEWFERNKKK